MSRDADPLPHLPRLATLLMALLATATFSIPAGAQTSNRERAQMLQLQQQIQRLQQDNAQLQQERAKDRVRIGALEQAAGSELDAARREAARLRGSQGASQRESRRLGEELEQTKASLATAEASLAQAQAELEKLRVELPRREAELQGLRDQLAEAQRQGEQQRQVMLTRLQHHRERAETCQAKHALALSVGEAVVGQWESDRLRACEPFTGLWRVKEETRIQAWRDQLFEARLDVPPSERPGTASR